MNFYWFSTAAHYYIFKKKKIKGKTFLIIIPKIKKSPDLPKGILIVCLLNLRHCPRIRGMK